VKTGLGVLVLLAVALAGCSKNADGDLVVKTPRVETQTDTLKMPTITTSKDTITTVTPTIEVKKETTTVTVPKVRVTRKP
jgi:PBP1b-binding outer membrane lipoprotein LpoB